MNSTFRFANQDLLLFSKNWGWFLMWGIVLFVLGLIAISAATTTTIISVIFLGILLFIAGFVLIVDTLTFWRKKWAGFFLHLIMALLYLFAGMYLIKSPLEGSASLTLLLGIVYIFLGIFRLIYSTAFRPYQWGWNLINGVITLLLGLLITANWPASSLFIIGLFVGIDLLFCGLSYIMASLSARSFRKAIAK